MASNYNFYPNQNRFGYAQNMLDPNGLTAGTNIGALQQQGAVADPNTQGSVAPVADLPHWLTDLSARGIGDDWSADTNGNNGLQIDMLHPRVLPPDAPAPALAQVQTQAASYAPLGPQGGVNSGDGDRKSTRLNSSHG